MSAADNALATKLFIERLPIEVRRNLYTAPTIELFWEFWEWVSSLPEPPTAATADEYIRSLDPGYWSESELEEALDGKSRTA